MPQTYLLRLDHEQVLAVSERLASDPSSGCCQTLGRKLRSYFSGYPQGCCSDCGAKLEGATYVSPESSELTEVVLEGFKAIEAGARIVCLSCYREAFHRVSGADAECPI